MTFPPPVPPREKSAIGAVVAAEILRKLRMTVGMTVG
jgi:hypothetical protein